MKVMAASRIRPTMVVLDLLDILSGASPDDPAWGLSLCETTGYGTGTVYPALDRLMKAELITDRWEEPTPTDRPRRRYYEITGAGRAWLADEVRKRQARRAGWLHPGNASGATS